MNLRTTVADRLSRVRGFSAWAAATAALRTHLDPNRARRMKDPAPVLDLGECLDALD